jgi:hypothetical protein
MNTSETRDEKDREHEQERISDRAPSSTGDRLGPILESFLRRFRKGERPSLTEYIGRYPALADEIRELLPALVEIEQMGSLGGAAALAGAGRAATPRVPGDQCPAEGTYSATEAHEPAAGPAAAIGDSTGPWPARLGDYRILGCIGEGAWA